MTNISTTELLPCPFCGDAGDKGRQTVTQMIEGRPQFDRITCRSCGAMCPENNWGRRVDLAASITDTQIDRIFSAHMNGFTTNADLRNAAREIIRTAIQPTLATMSSPAKKVGSEDVTNWNCARATGLDKPKCDKPCGMVFCGTDDAEDADAQATDASFQAAWEGVMRENSPRHIDGPVARYWMHEGWKAALAAPQPPEAMAPVKVDGEPEPMFYGRWHHGSGNLCCGSMRYFRADFDTNPAPDVREGIFDWVCTTMNAALDRWREQKREREDGLTAPPNPDTPAPNCRFIASGSRCVRACGSTECGEVKGENEMKQRDQSADPYGY